MTGVQTCALPIYGDYILGGFETDQTDGFAYADFESALRERMTRLIDDYLKEAILYNISLGMPNAEEEARQDLALVISDNLKVKVPYMDTETVVNTLMNNEKTQTWLFGIKQNVKEYQSTLSNFRGVYNTGVEMDTNSEEYKNAQYFTDDCTFEQFIEQLSSIEL